MTLSWLKINKMALPVEDVKVDHVAKVGNMTKGFLHHCCPGDFPEEPEKAVEKPLKKPEVKRLLGLQTGSYRSWKRTQFWEGCRSIGNGRRERRRRRR